MENSENLNLPYIASAQAQKHVTHNEAIRALDALLHLSVISASLTSPPASPVNGDRYIPASGANGAWTGHENAIAAFQDGGWIFYAAGEGWLSWIQDESTLKVFEDSHWTLVHADDSSSTGLSTSPHNAMTGFEILEEELTLIGPFVESSVPIPDRAIVLAVTVYTTQSITGATSFDCGTSNETNRYGGSLGISLGSQNIGVTGPVAYYADTPIRLSANGGDFSSGKVRISLHIIRCTAATS